MFLLWRYRLLLMTEFLGSSILHLSWSGHLCYSLKKVSLPGYVVWPQTEVLHSPFDRLIICIGLDTCREVDESQPSSREERP